MGMGCQIGGTWPEGRMEVVQNNYIQWGSQALQARKMVAVNVAQEAGQGRPEVGL
jgi:hypothetical protein